MLLATRERNGFPVENQSKMGSLCSPRRDPPLRGGVGGKTANGKTKSCRRAAQ